MVAFELLTGRARSPATPRRPRRSRTSAPIPPASQLRPDLPREVDAALARGLAKAPGDRYQPPRTSSTPCAPRSTTRPGRREFNPPPRRCGSRRGATRLLPLLALASSGPASSAAALLAGGDDETTATPTAPQTIRETIVQTVTTPAPTTQPETTQPATTQPTTTQPTTTETPPPASASELNDEGFALMQAGDYESALPLEQAVQLSSGSGELVEAYASYNLAFTRLSLGSCDGVLDLLRALRGVSGKRGEIKRLQRQAEKSCGGGDD